MSSESMRTRSPPTAAPPAAPGAPPGSRRLLREWPGAPARLRAVQDPPCRLLEPGVPAPRASADLVGVGDLIGEAGALPRDRVGDRRALRDLEDEPPEVRARERAVHDGRRHVVEP